MPADDFEARLRAELRAQVDETPFTLDAETVRRRLTTPRRASSWWGSWPRRFAVAGVGALVVLVAVIVTTAWLSAVRTLGPASQVGSRAAPPPHVLLVREVPRAQDEASGIPPLIKARLVDPLTLKPVAGAKEIDMGRIYQTGLSHDGRTLAVIRWPGDNPSNGELVLVSLADGSVSTTGVRVDGDVPFLAFTADDRSLVWLEGIRSPVNANYSLARYPLHGERQFTALPKNFWPSDARLLSSGDMAVFIQQADSRAASSSPHVLLMRANGTVRANVAVDGLIVGAVPQKDGKVASYNAGLAWDLRADRLYVAHADADVVTVVDLAAGRILARVDAAVQTSWAQWLGVGTAAAKFEPGTDRSAALSADGSRLYVVGGTRTSVGTGPDAKYGQTPNGGFVLDTRTLTRIGSIGLPVDRVLTASDGSLVFAGTSLKLSTETESETAARTELIVTDAQLQVTARKALPGQSWLIGLSADGQHAYVELGSSVVTLTLAGLTASSVGSGYWVEPSLH